MDLVTLFTYIGIFLFGLPAIFYVGLTYMMMKDLKREDETVKFVINFGFGMMIVGAIILIVRYFFMP